MRTLRHLGLGVGLALLTLLLVTSLEEALARRFLALLLAAIGAVYVGFALMDGRRGVLVLEVAAAAATFVCALYGLAVSPLGLVAGYAGHGVWDLLHHPRRSVGASVVPWYPLACLAYDWIVAVWILGTL